jgi:transposase
MVKPDDLPSDLASALVALRAEREARMQAEAVAASAQAKLSDTEALIAHLHSATIWERSARQSG